MTSEALATRLAGRNRSQGPSIRALMPASKSFSRNPVDQARLAIVVLEGAEYHLRAHYNPHEVQYEKAIGWNEKSLRGDHPHLDYTSAKARTMSLDLFFDCFELTGETLQDDLDTLARMTVPSNPESRNEENRRPPIVQIVNGPLPNFRCVIESVAVKVTMFDRLMRPVRATVNIKLKEVKAEREARDPVSLPRANFLEWTKPEQEAQYAAAEIKRREVEVRKVGPLE
jgi:hypothetical protein